MRETINKADWLATRQCTTLGWYRLRETESKPNVAEKFRMKQGQTIGAMARQLYPNGTLISNGAEESVAEATRQAIENTQCRTFFEAEFRVRPFTAKADILRRDGNGWHVLEVKSSFVDSGDINALIDDLAYTVFVIRRAGLAIRKASLVLLSRAFRYGDPSSTLFEIIDKTAEVNDRVVAFEKVANKLARALLGTTRPKPILLSACRDCGFFAAGCLGTGIAHTVFEVPDLSPKKLKRLSKDNIVDLSRIPNDLGLNDLQQRARNAALSGSIAVVGLKDSIESLKWPCHYLDFEPLRRFYRCTRDMDVINRC
jgi:hypothetical protein